MIYGQQTYARPMNSYAGSPVDEVRALNEAAAGQYSLARAAKDELDVLYNNIDVEDRNTDIKRRAIDGIRERFKDLAAQGNYQDAGFAVQDAKKAYDTDNELQAAIQSRQQQKQYQGDLQSRLKKGLAGEKGGISERQYNYAMQMSNLSNQERIQYDPETMTTKNSFRGYNVSDDLSKEISDTLMERAMKFKATGAIQAGGDKFEIRNIGGVQKIYRNATEEVNFNDVANALKMELGSNEAYKRYLDESRTIDKFNKLYDPNTKSLRKVDRFKDLGALTDEELEESFVGANKKTIEALSKSKSLDDKATLEELKDRQRSFDLNDPKVVEHLYDKISEKDQMNKFIYPAAEAASYIKYDDKIFTDELALENARQKNRVALEEFKHNLAEKDYPPPVTGVSQVNLRFTGQDYGKKKENLDSVEANLRRTKELLEAAPKDSSLYNTRKQDYEAALGQYNIARAEIKRFYNDLPVQAKGKIQENIDGLISYRPDEDPQKIGMFGKMSAQGLQSLMVEAERKKDTETMKALAEVRKGLVYGTLLPPSTKALLKDKLSADPDYLDIVAQEDSKVVDNAPYKYRSTIDNYITEAYNETGPDQSLRLTSIPRTGNIKEDSPLATHYYSVGRNILNNAKDLVDDSGIPFDKVISNQSDKKFWTLNEKGKWVQDFPDVSKPEISVASGSKDGVKRISVTYYSKDGKPLVVSEDAPEDDKASRPGLVLSSNDPNTLNSIYEAATKYAKQTGDEKTFYTLKGEMDYGNIFNKVRLGTTVDPFVLNTPSQGQLTIAFKSEDGESSTIIDMDRDLQGKPNPNFGKPLFNRLGTTDVGSTFRSNEDLLYTLSKYIK